MTRSMFFPVHRSRQRRRKPLRFLFVAAISLTLAVPLSVGSAGATGRSAPVDNPSVLSDWNSLAVATIAGDATKKPQETFLYQAFMNAAMYNAVVGVKGRYEPYRFDERARRGTSATAAAAAAAHKILETYSPYAQSTLDTALAASLAGLPDGSAKTNGISFGERAAEALITQQANDGRNGPTLFTKAPAPGVWRPTPPAFLPMFVPWLGGVTPLLVRSSIQFAPPAPPSLTSRRYTRDFTEVKAYGSAGSALRTAHQTATALFFSGNAAAQFTATLADQALERGLDIVDTARMFAAVSMSVSDSLITVWQAKLFYGEWRPITAIQLADTDGNPATAPDPGWLPLLTTPPYPDYPSGYVVVAAAATRALERLFGTHDLDLTLISTAVPGAVRHYDTGSQVRSAVVDARVWLGIHFRFADIASRTIGIQLTDWALRRYFAPERDRD
ncbi:MAG: hypothetical protein QOG98_257 [Pseudonocardiales bacterium]|nr:hypothetical protein [Pseudonocardiales bacterium]